jgi:sigma-B regulation protein RsbU (phosphoserine phosphatase)
MPVKLLHLAILFLPMFAAFFVLYNAQQNSDMRSRRMFWPYLLLGCKELFQYLLTLKYGFRSFYFLYTSKPLPGIPDWVAPAALTSDIVSVAVLAVFLMSWLAIPGWFRIVFLAVSCVVPSVLLGLSLAGTSVNVLFFLRIMFLAGITVGFIQMQKIYFEGGNNFVVDSKGYVAAGLLFLAPPLIFNFFNIVVLGHILRLGFYVLIIMPVFFMAYAYFKKSQEEKALLEREKDLIERLLNSIGSAIASNQDRATILDMVVHFATEATQARAGAIFLWNKKRTHLTVEVVTGTYPPLHPVDEFIASKEKYLVEKFKSELVLPGHSYVGKVAQSQESLLIANALENPDVVQSARGVMDISSVMCFPLMIEKESLGVLSLLNKTTDTSFQQSDFVLGQAMAEQIAVALNTVNLRNEYQEKMESEKQLAIAGQIQQDLLPTSFPDSDRIEIFATSRAAKGVSGDYYDLLNFGDRLATVMADVAGKGVPAALVMVMIRSAMRTIAKTDSEPREVVSAINRAIAGEVSQERYATLFMAIFDVHTGLLHYTNAGHGPMLVYRAGTDTFELLDTAGLPVGIAQETEYGQDDTVMNSGDVAVLYTDGITEAMNVRHEEYSMARLKEDLRKFRVLPAREIAGKILENISAFTGDEPQHDDETILVVKMK